MNRNMFIFILFNGILLLPLLTGIINNGPVEYVIMFGITDLGIYSFSSIVLVSNSNLKSESINKFVKYLLIYPIILSIALNIYFFVVKF